MKKFDTALVYLNMAQKEEPTALAYMNIGACHFNLGANDLALQNFNKAIQMDSNQAVFYFNRCNLFELMGKLDNACADWQAALNLEYDERKAEKIRKLCK